MTSKVIDFDPYQALGVQRGCTDKDIQKAYKTQCLKYHPDKNPGNEEEAQKKFILAKEAFDVLYDKEARAEYDRVKEKERVRDEKRAKRMDKADGERKRHMEDLERREKEHEESVKRKKAEMEREREEMEIQASWENLRKEMEKKINDRKLSQERERLEKEAEEEEEHAALLRVKWKRGDYDESSLRSMFSPYGAVRMITAILDMKKGGKQCAVEFEPGEQPWGAELEGGAEKERFKATWIKPPEQNKDQGSCSKESEEDLKAETAKEEDLSKLSFEELQERLLGVKAEYSESYVSFKKRTNEKFS